MATFDIWNLCFILLFSFICFCVQTKINLGEFRAGSCIRGAPYSIIIYDCTNYSCLFEIPHLMRTAAATTTTTTTTTTQRKTKTNTKSFCRIQFYIYRWLSVRILESTPVPLVVLRRRRSIRTLMYGPCFFLCVFFFSSSFEDVFNSIALCSACMLWMCIETECISLSPQATKCNHVQGTLHAYTVTLIEQILRQTRADTKKINLNLI